MNDGYTYRSQADDRADGQALIDYLCDRWQHSTRDEWLARIARGELKVGGALARPDDVLSAGQEVSWDRPPWVEPDVPLHYDLLYEDEALLGVGKPSGLPTLAAGGFLAHTLTALVQSRYPEARPLHRLGRGTSGVVLFARTAAAASALAAAWRQHAVEKRYRALSDGVAAKDHYVIETPIAAVPHPLLGSVQAAAAHGKRSRSVATVIQRRANSTLFQVEITTGRPHQIRIHLASVGHPLMGDPLYASGGVPKPGSSALPGDGGYFLHAERLRFAHPVTGALVEISSEPPETLR